MPSGHLMTMPVLLCNMGGEMVYILDQRLKAQKIPDTKGQKVLSDVVRTMYYPHFVEELFKPQAMYTIQSTRQIFDRLAHSSIMRLNESSMDKLFDLMAMGFKYQIISCLVPQELVQITQNHLGNLRKLVESTPQLPELLDECLRQVALAYDSMPIADLNALRQNLCAFFQERKVKVALFLHDKSQNSDGSLVVRSEGTLRAGSRLPGTVRYLDAGAEVHSESLPAVGAALWKPAAAAARTQLGANIYESRGGRGSSAESATPQLPKSSLAPAPAELAAPTATTAAAVGELNLLASLIGTSAAPAGETFKLESLFGAAVFSKDGRSYGADVIQIDGTAPSEHSSGLEAVRKQMEGLGSAAGGVDGPGDPDDLLDLMDKA